MYIAIFATILAQDEEMEYTVPILCVLFEKENKRPHAGLEWAQGNRQATTTERRGSIVSACPDLDSY